MSPLEIRTSSEAEKTVRGVCQDMARRLVSHPQGTCPVDVMRGLIALCRTQTCGKCVPCRIGLAQIESLLDSALEGTATEADLARIEALKTCAFQQIAQSVPKLPKWPLPGYAPSAKTTSSTQKAAACARPTIPFLAFKDAPQMSISLATSHW